MDGLLYPLFSAQISICFGIRIMTVAVKQCKYIGAKQGLMKIIVGDNENFLCMHTSMHSEQQTSEST